MLNNGILVKLLALVALVWLAAAPAHAQSANLNGFGVVLMHGKGGMPGGLIASTAAALQAAGAKVIMPEMPWSRTRMYAATYEDTMLEIDKAVAALKAQGATRIVVGGQSFGANAAIGYAARRDGLAGVVALAPGHVPERAVFSKLTAPGIARAKQLIAEGKGDAAGMFPDVNQAKTSEVRATAKIYLSLFDPNGPAPMPKNAATMKPVPFLWVIGRSDPLFSAGPDYAFNRSPKNPKSKYLEVKAGHENTPDVAKGDVVAWLKSL
ncbi:MAG: alpha/beta fold hydrolase [Bradyrhizobiaceae bacterium]|nr:alpha/beta fold hydrolase [Bradyrhizobiaceae bacterium]